MYYLSRNKEVVAEARVLFHPVRGSVVGSSLNSGALFTSLGSFPSSLLGEEVFLGIKEYTGYRAESQILQYRVLPELATISAIAEYVIGLRAALPAFYALLRGAKGKPIGILMEDFSQGGKHQVVSTRFVPPEIISLFGNDVLEGDLIQNMGFDVGGEIKLADLYPIFKTRRKGVAFSRHPMNQAIRQVKRNLWQHTIRLGRDL